MFRRMIDPFAFITCYLPLLVVTLSIVFFVIVLPILQAPSIEKIAKYARKCLKGDSELSRSGLRRRLRLRFAPNVGDSNISPATIIFIGFLFYWAFRYFNDVRNWIADHIVDSRIERVINALWAEGADDY